MVAISEMATENKRVFNKRMEASAQTRALFHFFQMSKLQLLVGKICCSRMKGSRVWHCSFRSQFGKHLSSVVLIKITRETYLVLLVIVSILSDVIVV